jgi:hypothetical protein
MTYPSTATVSSGLEWLESQDFYELCQQYRHSHEVSGHPGIPTVVEAFERLKLSIADAFVPLSAQSETAPTGAAETFYKERCLKLERELAEANRDVGHLHECLRQAAMQEDSAPSSAAVKAPHDRGALIERVAKALCLHAYPARSLEEAVAPSRELWMRLIPEAEIAVQAMESLPSATTTTSEAEKQNDSLNQLSGPGIYKT